MKSDDVDDMMQHYATRLIFNRLDTNPEFYYQDMFKHRSSVTIRTYTITQWYDSDLLPFFLKRSIDDVYTLRDM